MKKMGNGILLSLLVLLYVLHITKTDVLQSPHSAANVSPRSSPWEQKKFNAAVDQTERSYAPKKSPQKSSQLIAHVDKKSANRVKKRHLPQIPDPLISGVHYRGANFQPLKKSPEKSGYFPFAKPLAKWGTLITAYTALNQTTIPNQCPQKPRHLITDIEQAYEFAENYDAIYSRLIQRGTLATWNYESNTTDTNKEIENEMADKSFEFYSTYKEEAKKFAWKRFKQIDPILYRWFKLLIQPPQPEEDMTSVKCKISDKEAPEGDMAKIHGSAKICPYKSDGPCNLEREPDLERILEHSKDFDELAYVWAAYRNATGRKIRPLFINDIENANSGARESGFADLGHQYRSEYESDTFLDDVTRYMEEVQPLYEHLHAFVRRRIRKHYTMIKEDGPIPINVVGDMNGMVWAPLYEMVNPFKTEAPNVTTSMLKKKMKPLDMFKTAEKFYTSLGMKKMSKKFWKKSIFKKKTNVKMVCHPSAWDMGTGDDFRIKMCTEVNSKYFKTVSHEMGHIQYYMNYADLTYTFRDSANPGFTEAIGEVAVLSSSTPSYLQQIGLIKECHGDEKEQELTYLLQMALNYVTSLPGTFIVDLWRYAVYKRDIKPSELNRKWWEMRLKYQGVCPPFERTEKDFDIGSRYHIASYVEYMRYFIANVFQFQLYESLCKEANFKGPLHSCNFYKNKKVGALFRKFLSYGRMKPWQELIQMLTNNATSNVDTGSLLRYFEPLFEWLKKENEGHYVGWKSDNPMKCP